MPLPKRFHQIKERRINHHTKKEYAQTWCNWVVDENVLIATTKEQVTCSRCIKRRDRE